MPAEAPHAIPTDPIDPEVYRYAPRAPRRFVAVKRIAALAVVLGLLWVATSAAYSWSQQQYFVGSHDGKVTIYRGIDASLPGVSLNEPYEESDLMLDDLEDYAAQDVREGIEASSLEDARSTVRNLPVAEAP